MRHRGGRVELVQALLDVVLHLDVHLFELTRDHGAWVYAILFLIVFSETGFVVTPFLPGDSLLFVAGAVAAKGGMDVIVLMAFLLIAAIAGNQLNFAIARWLGPLIMASPRGARILKPEHVARTQAFFERHGGKTIVLSRFVPIVRTYAPFVAGLGGMRLGRFAAYNVLGALAWIVSLVVAGYFFGNLPIIRENLTVVVRGIVVLSVLPAAIEVIRARVAAHTG
jgi:membrane-associated protein